MVLPIMFIEDRFPFLFCIWLLIVSRKEDLDRMNESKEDQGNSKKRRLLHCQKIALVHFVNTKVFLLFCIVVERLSERVIGTS